MRLDYVLALKIEDFLERRLQTQVFKSGLAKSIHHARVLIRQRHIRYVSFPTHVPIGSARAVSASKSSMFPLSSSVLILKSTLTLLSLRHTEAVALVASSESVWPLLRRRRRVVTMMTKSKPPSHILQLCIFTTFHALYRMTSRPLCYYDACAHQPDGIIISKGNAYFDGSDK